MRRNIGLLMMSAALIVFAGCMGTPVYNIKNASITTLGGNEPTLEQVTKAIQRAAFKPTPPWRMKVVNPGHIRAALFIRGYTATVDINYTTKSYSITYIDSTNLKYDAANKTISNHYNSWIKNLENAINFEIAGL